MKIIEDSGDDQSILFEREDVWDYTTLGNIMVAWLKAFKEHFGNKQGISARYLYMVNDSPGKGFLEHWTDEEHEKAQALFNADIDKLIYALEDNIGMEEEPKDESLEEFALRYYEHEERVREGLELFPEIFRELWD